MKMTVKHQTIQNAQLMIWLFIPQPAECLLFSDDTTKEKVNSVKNLVIGYSTRNGIERLLCFLSFAA